MASKKSTIKVSTLVFVGLMLASAVIAIVGLFLNFAVYHNQIQDVTKTLFQLETPTGVCTMIFGVVSVILACALTAVVIFNGVTGKKTKMLTLVLTILTLAVALTFIILAIVSNAELTNKIMQVADQKYVLAVGPYLTFFGTVLVPFFSIAKSITK